MLKKRLFSIACAITIATAMCAVTGCGSSKSSGASQQGAGKVDYSALPKIDMPDKKIVIKSIMAVKWNPFWFRIKKFSPGL